MHRAPRGSQVVSLVITQLLQQQRTLVTGRTLLELGHADPARARARSAHLWVPSRHLRQPRPPCAVVSDARSRASSARAPRHWLSCSSTLAAPRRSPPRYSVCSSSRSFCAARAISMRSAWCTDTHALLPLCLVPTRLAARCAAGARSRRQTIWPRWLSVVQSAPVRGEHRGAQLVATLHAQEAHARQSTLQPDTMRHATCQKHSKHVPRHLQQHGWWPVPHVLQVGQARTRHQPARGKHQLRCKGL